MDALIQVRNLDVRFRLGKERLVDAVRGVSFDIPAQGTTALVGESGSGKTVSAMSLIQLLPPNASVGERSTAMMGNQDLLRMPRDAMRAIRGRDISVVFQEPMSSLNPVFTVGDQVAEVLRLHKGLGRAAALSAAAELLQLVGIPEPQRRLKAYPHELSGGQQQRVMIAVAIACEPKLLIADEPTTALDVTIQRQIMDLLARLQQQQRMSVLFISHDLALVGEIADHVVVMRDGEVREQGAVEQIFRAPQDAYTNALLACRPRLDQRPRRLPVIQDVIDHTPVDSGERKSTPAQGDPLLRVQALRKDFAVRAGLLRRQTFTAVQDASFELHRGRTLGVVGESGSGKTTLGLMVTRLLDATAGSIRLTDQELTTQDRGALKSMRRRVQIVFQNPYASLNPRFTVGQILLEPLRVHGMGTDDAERTTTVLGLLERVGLGASAFGKYPHEFSGGQRQRIAIARCLTLKPEVVICDESVSALDVSVQAAVLNLLLDLQEEYGLAYIFISHDLAVVKYMADEILVMHQGRIVEHGDAQKIYAQPEHAYTRQLLGAIPRGLQRTVGEVTS